MKTRNTFRFIALALPFVLFSWLGIVHEVMAQPTTFSSGIYYRLPNTSDPSTRLALLNEQLSTSIVLTSAGFDINESKVVFVSDSIVFVVSPNGSQQQIPVTGLRFMARPSLSPNGNRIVVQASIFPDAPPRDLNIYVIDLQTRQYQRIGMSPDNEESPEWFPLSNKIAYSSFSPQIGIDLHIYDLAAQREVLLIPGAGGLHLAISPDESKILEPGRMRIYSATTGAQLSDLDSTVTTALNNAGYNVDTRYPSRVPPRGTFSLDGDFSPDGQFIVFDGAVEKNGQYGVILCRVTVTGQSFEILLNPIAVNPTFSNNYNYSQLNPMYRKTSRTTGVIEDATTLPRGFELSQNYPNPFNPSTTIEFSLPSREAVTLSLFNGEGRWLETILQQTLQPGSYRIRVDSRGMASGVYFYRIVTSRFQQTREMIVI